MSRFVDARVPIWLDGEERPNAAYLLDGAQPAPPGAPAATLGPNPSHPAGCLCCTPRSAAAAALSGLFQDRARGRDVCFACVVVRAGGAGRQAAEAAVRDDPLCRAYFRLG